jgi:hypothetical protein
MNPPMLTNRLIWLYFWLLLSEGALRKWIVPGLSQPLLIIRDPVALAIYFAAVKEGIFPRNGWNYCLLILAILGAAVNFLGILSGLMQSSWFVAGYGLRTDFLHLPLIFVMQRAFTRKEVEEVGKWLLWLAVPMLFLVLLQFRSSPDAWINRGTGMGDQLSAAVGVDKIRPPGVFSFISGLVSYLSLSVVFVFYYFLQKPIYPKFLAYAATMALIAMVPLALSRSAFYSVAIVGAFALFGAIKIPVLWAKSFRSIVVIGGFSLVVSSWSVFHHASDLLNDRMQSSNGFKTGILDRFLEGFTSPFSLLFQTPLFGYGLGMGTNAASAYLTGQINFLLAEGEWGRVLLESGPILGLAYLIWRIAFAGKMVIEGWAGLAAGDLFPWLLVGSGLLPMLLGQFGQPTNLGFAVFEAGLFLAASHARDEAPGSSPAATKVKPPHLQRGRSVYAEHLHGS